MAIFSLVFLNCLITCVSVSVSKFPLFTYWIRALPVDLLLTWLPLWRPYFRMRLNSDPQGFGKDTTQPKTMRWPTFCIITSTKIVSACSFLMVWMSICILRIDSSTCSCYFITGPSFVNILTTFSPDRSSSKHFTHLSGPCPLEESWCPVHERNYEARLSFLQSLVGQTLCKHEHD